MDVDVQPSGPVHVQMLTASTLSQVAQWPAKGRQAPSFGWPRRGAGASAGVIAAGDAITISIWDNQSEGLMTTAGSKKVELPDIVVSASGDIFVPYLDKIHVLGMTTEGLRGALQQKYASMMADPQVQLSVKKGHGSSVELVTGVQKPGLFTLGEAKSTVSTVIAQGGGISGQILNPQLRLHRGGRLYGGPFEAIVKNASRDFKVEGGDKIFIEEDERYFIAYGASKAETRMTFPENEITAMEAVALLGGLKDERANAQSVLVLRNYGMLPPKAAPSGPPAPKVIFAMDLTSAEGLFAAGAFPMQDRDLLIVTEAEITRASSVLRIIGQITGLANW